MSLKINGLAPQLQLARRTSSSTWERSIARLSSGKRINSGSDDASGLSVSEKLRNQIRGLTRAMANTQDAISIVQSADGGLMEAQARLNRMRELSIQAQDGAYTASDRVEIQKEFDQMIASIDRIAQTTEFNQRLILDGSSSALVSTSDGEVQAYVNPAGEVLPEAGNYHIAIESDHYGAAQIQTSSPMQSSFTGSTASASSTLDSLSGFSELPSESTLILKGNQRKTEVHLSQSITLTDMAGAIQEAISGPSGLQMEGATFDYNQESGQFQFQSGYAGERGELEFVWGSEWDSVMAMQITQEAQKPSYILSSMRDGQKIRETRSSGVGAEIIEGLSLDFAPPAAATASVQLAHINPEFEPFTISITSTNTQPGYAPSTGFNGAPDAGKAIIEIKPKLGQTFADIVTEISIQIQATAPNMGITVSITGNQVFLVAPELGSSSKLDVVTNQAAAYLFSSESDPPTHFTVYGNGGTPGAIIGTQDLSGATPSALPFSCGFATQMVLLPRAPYSRRAFLATRTLWIRPTLPWPRSMPASGWKIAWATVLFRPILQMKAMTPFFRWKSTSQKSTLKSTPRFNSLWPMLTETMSEPCNPRMPLTLSFQPGSTA